MLSPLQKALWAAALGAAGLYLTVTAVSDDWWRGPAATGSADAQPSAIRAEFTLTDHRGQRRTDEEFDGRWLLVFFGFTNCPDVCPLGLATIADVMDRLGKEAEEVQPLFVSIDPDRDTPEAMAEYVEAFHAKIVGLTGSTEDVAEAAANFRAYYEKVDDQAAPDGYSMSHTSSIYLIGPDGTFIKPYSYKASPEENAADLEQRVAT